MERSLTPELTAEIFADLEAVNTEFARLYPGESAGRQPVHTVYGGAHLFKAETAQRLGEIALRTLHSYAPDFVTFAKALALPGANYLPDASDAVARLADQLAADAEGVRQKNEPAWLAYTVYRRVEEKLAREAVEDFRIDFEDGFGNRPDPEEDAVAAAAAREVAQGMANGQLPPFIGIRIKPLNEELKQRTVRTLDIFVSTLVAETDGRLPDNFVVTLPKVTMPEHVSACVRLFECLEAQTGLPEGALKMELMIEMPQAILNHEGGSTLPLLLAAAEGRCVGAHFGVYDYTAALNITAAYQTMTHPVCDFARQAMQVALAGTGIFLSDGATNIMPVPPHRWKEGNPPLTIDQERENREVVHRAWKIVYDDIRHSLRNGYYQGWDLHPGQLPVRYAAVAAFFLEGLEAASVRLKNFIDRAAQATLVGDVFDDAATGQALLNYFLRGINSGAITEAEALATGLTLEEIRSRSFVKILAGRRQGGNKVAQEDGR